MGVVSKTYTAGITYRTPGPPTCFRHFTLKPWSMALLESDIQFIGPLGKLSAYRMRGVDKIVIRKKGGASKKRIQNDPEFARTRENNSEFSGRAAGVRCVMRALETLRRVADYNIAGPINGLMSRVQFEDDINNRGKRSIFLSKYGFMLEGFSMNRYSTFENVVRAPLTYSISKETLSAKVDIPQLIPETNFFPKQKHPLFSVIAVLNVAPDLNWTDEGYQFTHPAYKPWTEEAATPWLHVTEGSPASTLELKINNLPPDNNFALMLTVGIRLGTPLSDGVDDIKHAGCGRIVRVV